MIDNPISPAGTDMVKADVESLVSVSESRSFAPTESKNASFFQAAREAASHVHPLNKDYAEILLNRILGSFAAPADSPTLMPYVPQYIGSRYSAHTDRLHDIAELSFSGKFAEAQRRVDQLGWVELQVDAYTIIAAAQIKQGDHAAARETLQYAEKLIEHHPEHMVPIVLPSRRSSKYETVARVQYMAGDDVGAKRSALKIFDTLKTHRSPGP